MFYCEKNVFLAQSDMVEDGETDILQGLLPELWKVPEG